MKAHIKKIQGMLLAVWVCIISCVFLLPLAANAEETDRKTVRVGYYPVSSFQELHEDGTRAGFSYDYYIQIQKYTRWNYEFVDASYADCLKMLCAGEIDLMSGLTATPEKEDVLIFSDYSISNTQNKLYAAKENPDLFYESYDTFDGARVGMINGLKTEDLEKYCLDHDFSVEQVKFSSYADVESALANNEIDMIYGSSLSADADVKIVARFRKQPLYYAVTREKPEIAQELDDALSKIVNNNPEFYAQMSEKYKVNGANASATFTREEDAYIKSGQQIYLVVSDTLAPVSWCDEETGAYRGISVDVAKKIEALTGLSIQPIMAEELDELAAKDPEVQHNTLVMTADDTAWAESRNIMMTNHVVDASIVMVSRIGETVDLSRPDAVIAMPRNYYTQFALKDVLADKEVALFDTVQECLDAVNEQKADGTFVNSLVARYYLSMLRYTNLYIYAESGFAENLAYGVYIDSATPLLSILDKALLCIGTAEISKIVIQYAHAEEKFSLAGFYYSNPELASVIVFVFCLLAGLAFYFRFKAETAVRRDRQEKTLARFMGYVCAANDAVMEVNLQDATVQSYTVDKEGRVTVEQIPYTKMSGQNSNERIYPGDFEKMRVCFTEETLNAMIDEGGGSNYFEGRAKDGQGVYRWYAYSLKGIPKDEEHPRNFIMFKKNIDEAKQAEQDSHQKLEEALQAAKEASEAKSGFLSRMSHELRTPINAIKGYNALIQSGVAGEPVDKEAILENVRESTLATDYLLAIISDILDIQAIEEGKITLVEEEIFADDYLKNILNMIKQPLEEKNIQFSFERVTKVCPYYRFDGVRFQQVLLNVLYNAIKFTPQDGAIHLSVGAIAHDSEKTTMEFVVSDTGIGMSREFVEQSLYQKFAQERQDLSTPYDGCGIGLAISKMLLDKMGGTISCESRLGEGTTFRIVITAKQVNKQVKRRSRRETLNFNLGGLRVLVCEDNKMNQDIEKKLLTKMNCEVDIAEDGQIGLDRVRESGEHYYDVILMDIRMPNLDGLAATRAIRALEREDVKTVPILAVSANAFEEDVRASLDAGMNEHLAKPVDVRILYQKIKQYCLENGSPESA